MQCALHPDIPINTMCVSTGWGSTGTWTVKFLKPACIELTTEDAYDYSSNVVGQVGSAKIARITVAAKNDAHIGLGENNQHDCNRYELAIGGWGNELS